MSPEPPSMEVVIARREQIAEGIVSLDLAPIDGGALPDRKAGAHIDVYVTPKLIRQYSICNDPSEHGLYRLGILLEPKSRGGSAEIHRSFIAGHRVKIGMPRNNFRIVETARHSVLLGGGIGITPLLAMAYDLKTKGMGFDLHYCTRAPARTAFLAELTRGALAPHVTFHYDDGPDAQRFSVAGSVPTFRNDTHVYLCGPAGFMASVKAELSRLGWSEDNVNSEHFSALVESSGTSFRVVASRSGATFDVPQGKTIASVLVEHGIEIPMSCEQGVCGTCLTKVIEGIPDHRDMYQSEKEKASNQQMTPCCSRAHSSVIVLDI
jgi:vanillate O-demethylase ferredoxin subunit